MTLVDVHGADNPFSLVNIFRSEKMRRKIAEVPPEYLKMDEQSLKRLAAPNNTDKLLKSRFWQGP